MKKFDNSKKQDFLKALPAASLDSDDDNCLYKRSKFNFSYFEKQAPGQGFDELSKEDLVKIINKIRDFSKESILFWKSQSIGKSGSVYASYGGFPSKSHFTHPKSVPSQVEWGRFRLDLSTRLCGFTIPRSYNGTLRGKNQMVFCSNTFYVVFLDPDHKFYPGERNS